MSTSSGLKARLERLAPVRDAAPPPSFSGAPVSLVLRRTGPFDRRLSVLARLRAAGLSLQAAHAAITRLAENASIVCTIAEGADILALARDLAALDVRVLRPAPRDPAEIAVVRAKHGLSQREFATMLGIDLDTLRNWEQGRNKPEAAALSLIRVFDAAPDLVTDTILQPVA